MRARTLLSALCTALTLAGCAQLDKPLTDNSAVGEFVYDERDVIPNDTPLPNEGINQRPVVGTKKVLVSVVHWQGERILNKPLIEKHTLSTDPTSLRSYILAASNGKLALTGQVIEHTSGPRPDLCIKKVPADPNQKWPPYPAPLAQEEAAKAAKAQGLDPDSFDYIISVIECGGAASAWGRNMNVYGQSGGPHVYYHEFGHNLAYDHGSTYTQCPKKDQTVTAPTGCDTISLGDTGDTVSGGGTLYPAFNRWYSGWLDNTQAATIKSSGLYRLGVLGSQGPQLYLISRPDDPSEPGRTLNYLSLEFRKPTIYDNFPPSDNRVSGVWVRFSTRVYYNSHIINYQLDGTPETATTADPTLLPGKILKDQAAGITVKVCTASALGATIAVSVNGEFLPNCKPTGILPPSIETPVAAAPATPNPIIFSGKSFPGARVDIYFRKVGEEWGVKTVDADATGFWRAPLPSLPAGSYNGRVIQSIGDNISLGNFRNFEVAP
ncbi:hypothetical protein [Pseudomonas sp. GM55]|uniref:hypothetical protein n=1 Tax=Pseudomonas sp. GM55 TaxID=1144333 RepID=UPI0002709F91|nr:hypothetical protein [Pseudomonas sp. GM55]EJM72388.1 hypothetical protein PMI31_03657 [Pseudomonas sp. GM55]